MTKNAQANLPMIGLVKRAEEIIATVFKQKRALMEAGRTPEKVVMSKSNYDMLEDYRRKLPPYPQGIPDYITQDSLFGLAIYIDNDHDCKVVWAAET